MVFISCIACAELHTFIWIAFCFVENVTIFIFYSYHNGLGIAIAARFCLQNDTNVRLHGYVLSEAQKKAWQRENVHIKFVKLICSTCTTAIIICNYTKCWLIQMPLASSVSLIHPFLFSFHSDDSLANVPCNRISGLKIIKEMERIVCVSDDWIYHLTCLLLSSFILISAAVYVLCIVCRFAIYAVVPSAHRANDISTTNHIYKISSHRICYFYSDKRTIWACTTEIKSNIYKATNGQWIVSVINLTPEITLICVMAPDHRRKVCGTSLECVRICSTECSKCKGYAMHSLMAAWKWTKNRRQQRQP